MAISYIGSAAGVNSATLPSHVAGDLIVAKAFRDNGDNATPALPSGWTGVATTTAARLAVLVATGSGTSSGTWTNATSVVFDVYRGASGIGATNSAVSVSTTVSYPALTMQVSDGTSWVGASAGHRSIDTALETPPTGMVLRGTYLDATAEAASFDTNGGVTAWTARTVSVGGTSNGYGSFVYEIRASAASSSGSAAVHGKAGTGTTAAALLAASVSTLSRGAAAASTAARIGAGASTGSRGFSTANTTASRIGGGAAVKGWAGVNTQAGARTASTVPVQGRASASGAGASRSQSAAVLQGTARTTVEARFQIGSTTSAEGRGRAVAGSSALLAAAGAATGRGTAQSVSGLRATAAFSVTSLGTVTVGIGSGTASVSVRSAGIATGLSVGKASGAGQIVGAAHSAGIVSVRVGAQISVFGYGRSAPNSATLVSSMAAVMAVGRTEAFGQAGAPLEVAAAANVGSEAALYSGALVATLAVLSTQGKGYVRATTRVGFVSGALISHPDRVLRPNIAGRTFAAEAPTRVFSPVVPNRNLN